MGWRDRLVSQMKRPGRAPAAPRRYGENQASRARSGRRSRRIQRCRHAIDLAQKAQRCATGTGRVLTVMWRLMDFGPRKALAGRQRAAVPGASVGRTPAFFRARTEAKAHGDRPAGADGDQARQMGTGVTTFPAHDVSRRALCLAITLRVHQTFCSRLPPGAVCHTTTSNRLYASGLPGPPIRLLCRVLRGAMIDGGASRWRWVPVLCSTQR